VRGVPKKSIAFVHRLVNETELTVLEIADAAVDHVRRRAGCAREEVATLDERDIHALQGKVAERGDSVDAATDDQDIGRRALSQCADRRTFCCGCALCCSHLGYSCLSLATSVAITN
jgi:hypothetical protein